MLLSAKLVALYGFIVIIPTVFAQAPGYGQCGGIGWTGPTTCVANFVCAVYNTYYSQCLPGASTTGTGTSTGTPASSTSRPQLSATSLAAIGKSIGWKYVGSATDGPEGNCTDATYVSIFQKQFNMATTGLALTWRETEPSQGIFNFSMADALVSWAQASNIMLRGQPLVWHAELPSWLDSSMNLQYALATHISVVVGQYRGSMYAWDVVNEVFLDDGSYRQSIFFTKLGASYISYAFNVARSIDSSAKLYINEDLGTSPDIKYSAIKTLVSTLKSSGVPIDGVGIQGHFVVGQVPSSLSSMLSGLASLGVEVAITELDVRMPVPASDANLAQQKKDYQSVFAACRAVKQCVGVSLWGLTDRYSWIPSMYPGYGAALPWGDYYNEKPAFAGAVAGMGH